MTHQCRKHKPTVPAPVAPPWLPCHMPSARRHLSLDLRTMTVPDSQDSGWQEALRYNSGAGGQGGVECMTRQANQETMAPSIAETAAMLVCLVPETAAPPSLRKVLGLTSSFRLHPGRAAQPYSPRPCLLTISG